MPKRNFFRFRCIFGRKKNSQKLGQISQSNDTLSNYSRKGPIYQVILQGVHVGYVKTYLCLHE